MNKKALIALLVIVIVALGGGLYYKQYMEKNSAPPSFQAVRTYQGLASQDTGFLKAEKSKTGADFKQTKKDKDGKDSTDKADLKFVSDTGGLSEVYSETDTTFDEIMKNFKAKEEGQEYMIGFYNVADGKWKTTKQTYYGSAGITVVTDDTALKETRVSAGNAFVFVSNKDSELYGYKDTSVEPTSSYDFCAKGEKGWNTGVVKKDDLYPSIAHCMDSVTSVWVKTKNYPQDSKFVKIYSSDGSTDALKAYKMSGFYMVWVKFAQAPVPVTPAQTVVKPTVSNLKVEGTAVNPAGSVSTDPTKELKFSWDSTYDKDAISQYLEKGKTHEILSYTWKIADSKGKTVWELTQDYGKANEGVSKDDTACFKTLYDRTDKVLPTRDWTCKFVTLPGDVKLNKDAQYTISVVAFDGGNLSDPRTITFSTEKTPQSSQLTDPNAIKLSANTAVASNIEPGATSVSFAGFEFIPQKSVSIKSITIEKGGTGQADDLTSLSLKLGNTTLATVKDTQVKFPLVISFGQPSIVLNAGQKAAIDLKVDISATAQVGSTHFLTLREIVFSDDTKLSPNISGNTMTIVKPNNKLEIANLKVEGTAVNAAGLVSIDPAKELKFAWDTTYNKSTIAQYKDALKKEPALSYTWTIKSAKGTKWELTQEYGQATDGGVTKDNDKCFVKLFGSDGKELISGKDWACNYTYLPASIALDADTEYTFELKTHDGTANTVTRATKFTTEKANTGGTDVFNVLDVILNLFK